MTLELRSSEATLRKLSEACDTGDVAPWTRGERRSAALVLLCRVIELYSVAGTFLRRPTINHERYGGAAGVDCRIGAFRCAFRFRSRWPVQRCPHAAASRCNRAIGSTKRPNYLVLVASEFALLTANVNARRIIWWEQLPRACVLERPLLRAGPGHFISREDSAPQIVRSSPTASKALETSFVHPESGYAALAIRAAHRAPACV